MKTRNHRLVWQGIHFRAYQYEAEVEPGVWEEHEYVYRRDGTRTLAIRADKTLLLSKEYRYELEAYDWRVPGGRLNDEKELVVEAAKREFKEETGFVADNWEFLWTTTLESTVRYQRHFFLATKLRFTEASRDQGERRITVHWIPIEEAYEMAMKGEIKEEISALAIARLVFEINKGLRNLR
jgi:8-oxo-dGTP pyrophosphatase MutT (NUDIX family)